MSTTTPPSKTPANVLRYVRIIKARVDGHTYLAIYENRENGFMQRENYECPCGHLVQDADIGPEGYTTEYLSRCITSTKIIVDERIAPG